ncbi:Rv1733c family protein [Kitasatospora sp. NPDC001660]
MSSSPRPARPASFPRQAGRQLRRALGGRHEPLARSVDRGRARAWALATLGLLLSLALATGGALLSYRAAAPQASAERGRLHQVDAVVLGPPRHGSAGGRLTGGYESRDEAEATWTYPDGRAHTGTVPAPWTATAGSAVRIWVDSGGAVVTPPLDRAAVAVSAACTGVGALLALLALLVVALRLRLRVLDRRSDESWTRAWARLEPLWSGRAGHRQDD